MFKSGLGMDMRPFDKNRQLVMGGVKIPDHPGLAGSYDSDILALAVCDSLAGAANLGELSELFPEDNVLYKNITGMKLMELIRIKMLRASLYIENIDATIICPSFNLSEYKTMMAMNIAHALDIEKNRISIKNSPALCNLVPAFKDGISVLAVCSVFLYEDSEDDQGRIEEEEEFYE